MISNKSTKLKDFNFLEIIPFDESILINGGGFWEDLGDMVGQGSRYFWETTKNMPRNLRSVGSGIPI